MFSIAVLQLSCRQGSSQHVANTDSVRLHKDTTHIPEPDIAVLRKNLWQYFERHKQQDVFDTSDDTYKSYWGPTEYPPYSVQAGHLFNDKQVHAVLYYSDDSGAAIHVFLKQGGDWHKIFEDTMVNGNPASAGPRFFDWNSDGIKDLCTYHMSRGTMSVIDTWDLWLMDSDGKKLHPLQGFDKLENPEVDSASHNLVTSLYYHGDRQSIFKFQNYKLIKLFDLQSIDDDRSDSVTLTLYHNGKEGRTFNTSIAKVKSYIPGWQGWY